MEMKELKRAEEGIKKLLFESDDSRPCKTYKYLSQEDRKALQTALSCIEFAKLSEGLEGLPEKMFCDMHPKNDNKNCMVCHINSKNNEAIDLCRSAWMRKIQNITKLREFIWERCQMDDYDTDEIMKAIQKELEGGI